MKPLVVAGSLANAAHLRLRDHHDAKALAGRVCSTRQLVSRAAFVANPPAKVAQPAPRSRPLCITAGRAMAPPRW